MACCIFYFLNSSINCSEDEWKLFQQMRQGIQGKLENTQDMLQCNRWIQLKHRGSQFAKSRAKHNINMLQCMLWGTNFFFPLSPLTLLWKHSETLWTLNQSPVVWPLTPADYVTLEKEGSVELCTAVHERSCRHQYQKGRARGRKRKKKELRWKSLAKQLHYWLPHQPQ